MQRQFGKSGLTDDLEALEAAGSFREENREATLTSITQREALENYEKSSYAAEGNYQKDPAKLTNTGKKEIQAISVVKTQLLLAPWVEFTFKNLQLKKKKIPVYCVSMQRSVFYSLLARAQIRVCS